PGRLGEIGGVERVVQMLQPFKLPSRDFQPAKSKVTLGPADGRSGPADGRNGGVTIGGKGIVVIAGPCSVESRQQLRETAQAVKEAGAHALRGGAFKPRTSPYSFQGLGQEGLELLSEVSREFGMPIVTEVITPSDVP